MLSASKKGKIRQLLKNLQAVVSEYSDDEINEHKDIFTAVLDLVEKLEYIKKNENSWNGGYTVPKTIYLEGYDGE